MPKRPPSLMRRTIWRVQLAAFLLLMGVIRLLPLPLVFKVGHGLGGIAHGLTRRYRQIVRRNLRIALYRDNVDLTEIDHLTKRVFQLTGANLFSALKTATLTPTELDRIVEIKNLDFIEEAAQRGNGVVLLLAHMGNWELIAQLSFLLPEGMKGGTHYRKLNNPYINSRIEKQRQRVGTRLFAKRASSHEITAFIRENGVLGILSDQRAGKKGTPCAFFGRLTGCTPMPALLAKRAGADVLALAVATEGIAKWSFTWKKCEAPYTTQRLMTTLEESLASSMADGFWLQDRWRIRKFGDLLVDPSMDLLATTTPCRVLLVVDGVDEARLRTHPLRPDLTLERVERSQLSPQRLSELNEDHRAPLEAIIAREKDPELKLMAKELSLSVLTLPEEGE